MQANAVHLLRQHKLKNQKTKEQLNGYKRFKQILHVCTEKDHINDRNVCVRLIAFSFYIDAINNQRWLEYVFLVTFLVIYIT